MDLVEAFKHPTVHIADKSTVDTLIQQFIADGVDKLQIISDFDGTISKTSHKGKTCSSCHNILDTSPLLPEIYRIKATELQNTYFPIEIDPSLTIEEKCPKMVEWWTKSHDLLALCKISKLSIEQMVKLSDAKLRDGCNWQFEELNKHNVPMLIFSAGLGDVILEILRQQSKIYNNMKIVSNFMNFDEQGIHTGFKDEIIHTFNKNENAVHKSEYFKKLKNCTNVILMGDMLGDLRMADGVENPKNVLKIGFLNYKVAESLELYKQSYDIVLQNDETMDIVNTIIRLITKAS